jgi:RNA recognition motif-containing protein
VIQFATPDQANIAIQQYNGIDLVGRTLSVKLDSFA